MKRVMLAALVLAACSAGIPHAQDENNSDIVSEQQIGADQGGMARFGRMFDTEPGVLFGRLADAEMYLEYITELKLTDIQVSELSSLQTDHDNSRINFSIRLRMLEGELERILAEDDPNLEYLRSKVDETQTMISERLDYEIDYVIQSREVLTGSQRALSETIIVTP